MPSTYPQSTRCAPDPVTAAMVLAAHSTISLFLNDTAFISPYRAAPGESAGPFSCCSRGVRTPGLLWHADFSWWPTVMQGKAPEPTSDKVRVVHVPGGRAYTREFSGFATGLSAQLVEIRYGILLMLQRIPGLQERLVTEV